MIDLDKFAKEELPRIKDHHCEPYSPDPIQCVTCLLYEAFESAMEALKNERERCAKKADRHEGMIARVIADEIREGE